MGLINIGGTGNILVLYRNIFCMVFGQRSGVHSWSVQFSIDDGNSRYKTGLKSLDLHLLLVLLLLLLLHSMAYRTIEPLSSSSYFYKAHNFNNPWTPQLALCYHVSISDFTNCEVGFWYKSLVYFSFIVAL